MSSGSDKNEKINIHEALEDNQNIFERDILERRSLSTRILSRLQEEDCPHVIGIYGGWGTGKTSLLHLINQQNKQLTVGSGSKLHLEIIDAWEYESSDGLLIPVVVELNKIAGNEIPPMIWSIIVKRVLFSSTLFLAESALKMKFNADQVESGFKKIKETIADAAVHDADVSHEVILQKWKKDAKEIKETKQAFSSLVDSACKHTESKNIVLCIDNLDRCSPDHVVRLLESVKVFFNVPHCTWVFAMDAEVIASYINHKYEGTRMDGNSYLDKIIPEQYHLSLSPTLDRKKIVRLLRSLIGSNSFEINENDIPQIPRVLVPRRLIKSAAKVLDFSKSIPHDGTRASQILVFYLALLYHAWPDFYQRLSSSSEAHIRSILDNFFQSETPVQAASEPPLPNKTNLLPLLKDYAEDQDLVYYIKTVFSDYGDQRKKNIFVDEIISGISGLRKIGLP